MPIESWSTVGYLDWDVGMFRPGGSRWPKDSGCRGGSSLGKASVVELVGQGRVEHKVRYGLCLGVKRLSCA